MFIPQPRHKLKRSPVAGARIVQPIAQNQLAWRNGSMIVVGPDAQLPPHCIFCDRSTNRRLKRTYGFSTPFTGSLYYVASALSLLTRSSYAVQESITVHVSVCDGCWRPRKNKTIRQASIGIALLFLPVVILLLLGYFQFDISDLSRRNNPWGFVIFSPFMIGLYLLHLAIASEYVLELARIGEVRWTPNFDGSEYFIWLTGASEVFLRRLPDWDVKLEVQDFRKKVRDRTP